MLTKPLVDLIQSQDTSQTVDRETVSGSKKSIRRLSRLRNTQQANSVLNRLTLQLRHCVELAQEKGASSWLSVLPLEEYIFFSIFRDALCLR